MHPLVVRYIVINPLLRCTTQNDISYYPHTLEKMDPFSSQTLVFSIIKTLTITPIKEIFDLLYLLCELLCNTTVQ